MMSVSRSHQKCQDPTGSVSVTKEQTALLNDITTTPQETVGEDRIVPGTPALQSGVIGGLRLD
jgi:hypothetical protein